VDLENIRKRQKKLRRDTGDKEILTVSQISGFFIPDWASGTEKDRSKGSQQHKEIEDDAEEISEEEMWERIKDEGAFPEWFVRAEYSKYDVVLSGKIDFAYFRDGKPELVIERKYPREKNLNKVYQSEKVQAWTYSFMLEQAGFQTESLDYVITKLPRETPLGKAQELDQILIKASAKNNLQSRVNDLKSDTTFNLYGQRYSSDQRISDLRDAVNSQV
jgi:hypothetical protein